MAAKCDQPTAVESIARRYAATQVRRQGAAGGCFRIGNRRVCLEVLDMSRARSAEPRLRFDRVALGLIARLQESLSASVPDGRTVVVTVTAPSRQDSRTGAILSQEIGGLLAAGRTSLRRTIHGNRTEVRILAGGTARTPRLVGFVHNPKPDPALLFEATRCVLARIDSGKSTRSGERWLVIDNRDGLSPVRALAQVCSALRVAQVFRRILLADPGDRIRALPKT
jgi:hypothetical protein